MNPATRSIRRRHTPCLLWALAALSGFVLGACSQDKGPKTPSRQPATDTITATGTGTGTGATGASASLTISPETLPPYRFTAGQPLNLYFRVVGDAGRNVVAALAETPPGARITLTPGRATLTWDLPQVGTYGLRILVRDMNQCAAVETANPAACPLTDALASTAAIQPKPYDAATDRLTLEVVATGIIATGTGTGITTGTNPTGLIGQITNLAGGSAGGLLSGLSTGQLQQVLAMLQGGSGGSLASIVAAVVGGLALTDEEVGIDLGTDTDSEP